MEITATFVPMYAQVISYFLTRLNDIHLCMFTIHTCQSLRVGRSHYAFLDKLTTTGVVGKDYGFMLVWRCNFVGNHLITFGLFLDEVMGLSQYC